MFDDSTQTISGGVADFHVAGIAHFFHIRCGDSLYRSLVGGGRKLKTGKVRVKISSNGLKEGPWE